MALDDFDRESQALCTRAVHNALQHLEARDVAALRRDLEELRETFVYSNYEFYRDWGEAKPRIVRLLFESLPFEEFLNCYTGRNFFKFEIWSHLDEIVGAIPISQLQILCEKFRFPHPKTAPNSVERLANAPEPQITPWLLDWIDAYFERERETIVNGIYVWSSPLCDALTILARRRDAVDSCAAMLRERRFGETLLSLNLNIALLDGLGAQNEEQSRRALLKLAQDEAPPGDFRLSLLANIAAFEPREALQGALSDLQKARETSVTDSYLRWFQSNAARLQDAARRVAPQIDTAHFDAISRATLADIWARQYPFWPLQVSKTSRAILSVAERFRRFQTINFGCTTLLFGFPALGVLWLWFLNSYVGPPAYGLRWVERWPFVAWTDLILLLIVWPLFAGGQLWHEPHPCESVRTKWESAFSFYSATLAFLLGTLLVRLWPQ